MKTLVFWPTLLIMLAVTIGAMIFSWTAQPSSAAPEGHDLQMKAITADRDGSALNNDRRDNLLINNPLVKVAVPNTCNSVVFAQIPVSPGANASQNPLLFIGRRLTNGCKGDVGLALFSFDAKTNTMTFIKYVLLGSYKAAVSATKTVTVNGGGVDPSVVYYNGEYWVAWECRGVSPARGTATCIGPLDLRTGTIDRDRITGIIKAGSFDDQIPDSKYSYYPTNNQYSYSASCPNLFVFHNDVYVYWSAIKGTNQPGSVWKSISIRGMRLVQTKQGGSTGFWGADSNASSIASYDPKHNVAVAVPDNEPYSNQSADIKGVYVKDDDIYLIAALGGTGPQHDCNCVNPAGNSYGCWRMQIFKSSSPLEEDTFNHHPLYSPRTPFNPSAYQRFFVAPDGSLNIVGMFFAPLPNKFSYPYLLPVGTVGCLIRYPIDLASLKFRNTHSHIGP